MAKIDYLDKIINSLDKASFHLDQAYKNRNKNKKKCYQHTKYALYHTDKSKKYSALQAGRKNQPTDRELYLKAYDDTKKIVVNNFLGKI